MLRPQDDGGWALVSTLGIVFLLSLLAAATQQIAAHAYRAERRATMNAQADALLEAGITRGVLALLDANAAARWAPDGFAHPFEFQGIRLKVSVQDESGKLDINASDTTALTRLFRAAGLEELESETLADRIVDWRSPSGLKHLHGATDENYAHVGIKWHQRHGPFQSVEEARLVLGMTPEIFDRVAPLLTVYTHRTTIDPAFATNTVLLTFPGIDENEADHIIAERQSHDRDQPDTFPLSIMPAGAMQGRVFTISVAMVFRQRPYFKSAVIVLSNSPEHFFVLA